MVVISFYLLGRDPKKSTDIHMVDIDITYDLDAAKSYVADSFSIVDPAGVGFQTPDGTAITDLETLLDAEQPIAVTVDGHAVRAVPSPKGLPVIGNYYQVYPDHMGNHQRMYNELGNTIQHTDLGRNTYWTCEPAIAAQMFQENEFWSKKIINSHPLLPAKDNTAGLFICDTDTENWRLVHKFIPPALSPKAVRHYTPMLQKHTETSFAVFDTFCQQQEAFDVFAYMFKLTSSIVSKLVLGVDMNHFESPDSPLDPLVSSLLSFLNLNKKVGDIGGWYTHLPFGDPKKLRDIQAKFFATVGEHVRDAQERAGSDLPMATAALEATSIADFSARAIDEQGNKLPFEAAVRAIPIVLGAGFITTTTLLTWMISCVTQYPEVHDKLLQELVDHGVTSDTQWTFDTTNELRYLDRFIKEVQRLYNPAIQPARTALRDQIVPGGYFIPKDTVMLCTLHALHRNPAVWDDALKFDPDRWDTDKVRQRPAGSYIPFATGPRSCIGFNFALQEAKTVFATLFYRYDFTKFGDTHLKYDQNSLVYKPESFFVQIRQRTSWPEKSQG